MHARVFDNLKHPPSAEINGEVQKKRGIFIWCSLTFKGLMIKSQGMFSGGILWLRYPDGIY